jgi:hypothetical protein
LPVSFFVLSSSFSQYPYEYRRILCQSPSGILTVAARRREHCKKPPGAYGSP